jgi:hypothetical protein
MDSKSIRSELIASRNQDRRNTYSQLFQGVRDGNEEQVKKAVMKMSIPAGSAVDVGFSSHDLKHFLAPIQEKLNGNNEGYRGFRAVLAFKKDQLVKHNSKVGNGAGNNATACKFRDDLSMQIADLSAKVKVFEQVEKVLVAQLHRRGVVVIQEEHRTSFDVVKASDVW